MEMTYRKVGRRYVPFEPFTGFPADGVWLVRKNGKSSTMTVYIDELDGCDMRVVAELSKKYDVLADFLVHLDGGTPNEIATMIIALLSKHDHKQPEETW